MKSSLASAFARLARSFSGTSFAPRARRALLGATLAVTATSAATNVASIPYRIPEFPLSSFPDSPNVPRYDEFEYAEESHYPGPPKPPARYEWSDRAKEIFTSFEEDGYIPLPFIYHPHSFIAGGHGVERRVRYHFLLKKGTIPAPGTPEAEAAAAAAAVANSASAAATTASPVPSSAPFGAAGGKGGRPALPTPADFGPEGNIMSLAGVVHFGPDAQGPKDCVHGGAIAALADSVMALAVASTGMACVTANLNVNYKNLIRTSSIQDISHFFESTTALHLPAHLNPPLES